MASARKYLLGISLLTPIVALSLVIWFVGHPLFHQTPLTHDHPTHLFKAWHFYQKMLPEFHLRGFSFYWVFGHPAGELVPIGEEIWVALFRVLTFEQLSWLRTYSLSLFGLLVLIAFSAYSLASHYFGRLAGFFSGALALLDPGGWAQAGWEWFMNFGVWPNSLGVSFLLFSLVALERVGDRFSIGRFLCASSLVMAALMSHQISIVFLPPLFALMMLDRWVTGRLRTSSFKNMTAALLLGAGLSAFYVVPMLARTGLTLDLGVIGVPAGDVGIRLVDGRYFAGMWSMLLPLSFVGAFVALRRRKPGAIFLSVGVGLFTLGSTDFALSALHLDALFPFVTKVEAARILVGAKMLWFPLTAYAISLPFESLLPSLGRFSRAPRAEFRRLELRWVFAWILGLLLLVPYLPAVAHRLYYGQVKKDLPPEDVPYYQDLKKVWTKTKQLREEQSEPYRIAYDLPMHDHIATLAPVFDDTWIYKVGYTPTQGFRSFPMYFEKTLLRKLLVKYVVTTRALPSASYRKEGTFGALQLYENLDFEGNPFELFGAGKAKLVELSPERIAIQLEATAENSRLQVFVSNIDHWQATISGRELPITPATISGAEDPFLMEVPASDGLIEFKYVSRAPDIAGRVWTASSLLALCFWLFLRWRRAKNLADPALLESTKRWKDKLSPSLPQPISWRAKLVLIAVALGLTGAWATARAASRTAFVNKDSLFHSVKASDLSLDGSPCRSKQPFSYLCGSKQLIAQRVSGLYGSHLCLTAPAANKLTLEKRQTFAAAIRGKYDVKGGHGRISVKIDGDPIGTVKTRNRDQGLQFLRFDTRQHTGETGQLTIEMRGAPLYCFDFSIEP